MSEGFVGQFRKTFRAHLLLAIICAGLAQAGLTYLLLQYTGLEIPMIISILVSSWIIISLILGNALATHLARPMTTLSEAILHVSPHEHLVAAPDVDKLTLGREMVTTLTRQIYDFASNSQNVPSGQQAPAFAALDELPICVLGLSEGGKLTFVNLAARSAFTLNDVIGLELESQLEMRFTDENNLLKWIANCKQTSVSAQNTWEKVEICSAASETGSYYDMVVSFRGHHSSGSETIIVLFDHGKAYEMEAEAIGLISLAVHELRTPLTILRGYIEVLEDELSGTANDEMKGYMSRMSTSAENLATFVSNILNVARAEKSELSLRLAEEDWTKTLTEIVDVMQARAQVRGKQIELTIDKGLPTVGVDRVSIAEVMTNLIDNAIKYSPETAPLISVHAGLDTDGAILTTVEDHGAGIPESVVPNLFNKFYRNHRNRTQIAGTGLGLYISKAIVTAHHGHIWVKSKDGAGSTFGFTVMPFATLAETIKTDDNNSMIRASHGWIKNHSMQRR